MSQAKENALQTIISDGYNAAKEVLANWSSGDLAGAVNGLEAWAETAKHFVPVSEGTLGNQHGFRCPQCMSGERITIHAVQNIVAELSPDGCDDDGGDIEWSDDDSTECRDCSWSGTVKDLFVVEIGEDEEDEDEAAEADAN